MFMYLIGTDWFKNNNPLSIAMTSVIKILLKRNSYLTLHVPTLKFISLFNQISQQKPTIAKSFHYPF